jgi:hypothetical protein
VHSLIGTCEQKQEEQWKTVKIQYAGDDACLTVLVEMVFDAMLMTQNDVLLYVTVRG